MSGNLFIDCAAAFAASLKLDSSHIRFAQLKYLRPNTQLPDFPRSPVGAVEPQRGRDSGRSGNLFIDSAAVFAASLKLDSSHTRFAQFKYLRPSTQLPDFPRPPVGAVEPQRGRDSGVSGNLFIDSAAAFAASLKLDSSCIRFEQPKYLRPSTQLPDFPRPPVGAVEPQRGRDSGVSGNLFIDSAAVFAASLKLDSSHIRFAQAECLRSNTQPPAPSRNLWELSSPSEAAIAVCQATSLSTVPPPSQPRQGPTTPTFTAMCLSAGFQPSR